jgi:uncharacterized damage-inducible protein DinB
MHPTAALFGRHAWATRELLRFCRSLQPDLLEREAPGTRGSIRTTLTHLVGTEQLLLSIVTGEEAGDPIRRGERRDLAALEPLADENARRWRSVLAASPDPERQTWRTQDGRRTGTPGWVVMVQCVHHGDEHQAHVGSVLGAVGQPRLDGWAFLSCDDRWDAPPGAWADALLARFVAFSGWATGEVLEHCLGLGGRALEATAPGTYGSVRETLAHLVGSDGSFVGWVSGVPTVPLEGAPSPDALRSAARRSREAWSAYLESGPDHERLADDGEEHLAPAWVLAVQALQHAGEHRAHVATILGANGLPLPAADAWAYGEAVEATRDR